MNELRRRVDMRVLVLIGACLIAYANSLANGFALDDVPIIQGNSSIHHLGDWSAILLRPYWPQFGIELGLWRPVVSFSFALQWAAGGGDPLIFHVVSVLLHAAVTVLAFYFLARLVPEGAAFAGALLFAVHPIHTEVVANIVGQAEMIAAAAVIGACLLHASRPAGVFVSMRRQLGLIALFALAILTKEHAVVLPALLLLVDVAQRRLKFTRAGVVEYLHAVTIPLLLLSCVLVAYLTVRYSVLEGHLTGLEAGPQHYYLQGEFRVLNALRAMPELFRLLVFPLDLAADYGPAQILPVESFTPMVAMGAMLLAATVFFTMISPWKPAIGFPAGWFLFSIITVSNLFFPVGVLIAERTLYLASLAACAAAAYAWIAMEPELTARARSAVRIGFVAVVVAFAARTAIRNPDWASTRALTYSLVRDHPESYKAQWTMAASAWEGGDIAGASNHFQLAMRLYPHDSRLTTVYANFLLERNRVGPAVQLLEAAYRMHPYITNTMMQLASTYITAGRFADAIAITRTANRAGVEVAATAPISAVAQYSLGNAGRAVGEWRYVIRHSELESPMVWAFIARPLAEQGFNNEAIQAVERGMKAAGKDSVAAGRMLRVRKAVLEGCYRSLQKSICDPLGPGLSSRSAAQSATQLQNAINRTGAPVVTGTAK